MNLKILTIATFIACLLFLPSAEAVREWCWVDEQTGNQGLAENLITTYTIEAASNDDLARKCKQKCYGHNDCRLISYFHSRTSLSHSCRIYNKNEWQITSESKTVQCPYGP